MALFSFLFRRGGGRGGGGRGKNKNKKGDPNNNTHQPTPSSAKLAPYSGGRTKFLLRGDSPTQPVVEEPSEGMVVASHSPEAARRGGTTAKPQQPLQLSPPTSPRAGGGGPDDSPPPNVVNLSPRSTGPVDLDEQVDSDNNSDNDDDDDNGGRPVFRLAEDLRFSAGNVPTHDPDEDATDDGDGSTFNLSTDAEDMEYESMRRRLGVGMMMHHHQQQLQVPLDSASLATEEDRSVFPNLPSEDEFTANSATKEASTHSLLQQINPRTGAALVPESVHKPSEPQQQQMPRKREFTTPKPLPPKEFTTSKPMPTQTSANSSHHQQPAATAAAAIIPLPKEYSALSNNKPLLSTANEVATTTKLQASTAGAKATTTEGGNGASSFAPSSNGFGEFSADPAFDGFEFPFSSPASTTKPRKLALSTKDAPDSRRRKAGYGNSSHFGAISNHNNINDSVSPSKSSNHHKSQRDPAGFDPFSSDGWATFLEPKKTTSPTATAAAKAATATAPITTNTTTTTKKKPVVSVANETKLEELLTQAKSKSRRGNTSINSAPALSASYLRQQHGLGAAPRKETTSVTDIISSLEAANASRPSRSSSRSLSGQQQQQIAGRSIRSPSEGARSRRRSQSRQRHVTTSDSEEDNDDTNNNPRSNKDQENWLFDEVTGALGPRGIAADLESLSGRSNRSQRSKNSARSGKSGKSGRSRRSHSHSRTTTHGNDSVDSRRSRYSTKSYISQMSEQSRSVAADLLRLERQLAMVGANERPHRPTTRRARITVTAPPGKLGIILANKADAKGTVVSGVRTSSVLADKIAPGDRIVAIDGEDVSLMTVSEITSIMARKNEYERTLTVLTTPREVRH
jgi:PDZ domain